MPAKYISTSLLYFGSADVEILDTDLGINILQRLVCARFKALSPISVQPSFIIRSSEITLPSNRLLHNRVAFIVAPSLNTEPLKSGLVGV